MIALLTLLIVGGGLAAMLGVAYAVPIRRTYRKEHGLPLSTPGPQVRGRERDLVSAN